MDYKQFVLTCDSLIKGGQIPAVSSLISQINFAQVPRPWRQSLAKVCRRSGLINEGLRLLFPIIRNEHPLDQPASAAEICEYAVLLSRNGSSHEALGLLGKIDEIKTPEALLYRGFCQVSSWNYFDAAISFEKFLISSADEYSKLIARVNLAAAYIANLQLDQAENLLHETIKIAKEHLATRLVGNCFELRGQICFFRGNFLQAKLELNQALKIFGEGSSYDQLLIYKWQSTMESIEGKTILPILKFREEALLRKHWESVRDTDFYRLKLNFEQSTYDHLIFGTPSEFYKNRVRLAIHNQPSDQFIYGTHTGRRLNLQTGELEGLKENIQGNKIHQVLASLLKDFYVPHNLGTLFADLYPNEYFDIDSSPQRIHQLLRRTRRWLETNEVPALIEEALGSYCLKITGPFGIQMALARPQVDTYSAQWQMIVAAFPCGTMFNAKSACTKLGISRTQFHRLQSWALENSLIKISGVNKATTYQVANSNGL